MTIFAGIILFFGGIFGGFYGSTVGSVSLVSFPLLLWSGLPVHLALGTNRFAVIFLEIVAAWRFARNGELRWKEGLLLGIPAIIGAYFGANLVLELDEDVLRIITSVLLAVIFLVFLVKKKLGATKHNISRRSLILLMPFILGLGVYGGFFGAGFGTMLMFALVTAGGSFKKSAGICRLVGFFMGAMASAVFVVHGAVEFSHAAPLAAGFLIGAWWGAETGIKKGNKYIKTLLTVVIVLTVVKLVVEVVG